MNQRTTKHKVAITALLKKKHLLTLKELSEQLPAIDFSTIYRNIKKSVQDGIINEVQIDKDTVAYELVSEPHDHAICERCNDVQTILLPETVRGVVPAGFSIQFGKNIIRGVCKLCK
jgi:Fe2+ or Zn2+ uptake regulation protein